MSSDKKKCNKCKVELPATTEYFYGRKDSNIGLRSSCKVCEGEVRKKWRKKNPCRSQYNTKRKREYERKRKANNPEYKLLANLRCRLTNAVKTKKDSIKNLVGIPMKDLMAYLESQFTEGMTWDNQGAWHIDHIKPCASFDLTKLSEQKKCFHYTNLQPLWAKDNLRKGKKYV